MKTLKRILSLLICLTLTISIFPALPAFAETYSGTCGDNLTWTLDTDTGVLTISGMGDMTNFTSNWDAPWNKYRTIITLAQIGNNVTSIGNFAFSICTALTSVTIPDSVTTIGREAFYECTSLTSVTIPDNVTSIGICAFEHCAALTAVTIPNSVISIGSNAFNDCGNLNITVASDNPYYSSIDGVLFNKNQTVLITYQRGKICQEYVIPYGVTSIEDCAFEHSTALASLIIPDSVTSIGLEAFWDCTALTNITIPAGVTTIRELAFAGCGNLNITVDPNNLYYSSIDGVLFNKNQTEIIAYSKDRICPQYTIPSGVTSINDWAFDECMALANVTIPDSVTSIGMGSFCECTSLTSVTIPNSVTSIGDSAFAGCTSLTSITISNNIESINEGTFNACESLTHVTIPTNVTCIGDYAFGDCITLTSIIIPDDITNIGEGAFSWSNSLTDVYYAGNEDDWATITIGSLNKCLTSATIHYNSSPADDEIKVYLNGTMLSFDQSPIMINNRTMVPLRAIFEAMGYSVEWNNTTQTAQAVKNSDTITVQIGNNTISYVTNGQSGTYVCDVAPQIISDRTLVPARAIAESAGCTVEWDGSTQTVTITANTEN